MSPTGRAAPPGTAGAAGPPTAGARLRVAFVDDDTVIRIGTPILLDTVDSAGSFASVEALLHAHPPADVVLLDLHLTGTGRLDVIQGANAIGVVTKAGYRVLIYTNERRREVLAGCLAAGAHGVVHKAEPLERVADALAAVSRDEVVITTALAGLAEVVDRFGQLPALTPRQREVLSRRARGEQYQQIASYLGISVRTVEGHLAEIGQRFADYLRHHSAADLERHLGVGPGDVLHRP
jgi:DNA-binding NarL/FixJ family response regulator